MENQECSCVPYENICCCDPQEGISVVQPECQVIPDGTVVPNPYFIVQPIHKSFWTYKFITDCASSTRAISNIAIPICENIIEQHIIVYEKIDCCGAFNPVDFELIKNDPNFGPAPEGYRFLKVENKLNEEARYEKGVCVAYILEISGNFPIGNEDINVKAGQNILAFGCGDCFLVPKCPQEGQLFIAKECGKKIQNNTVTLEYNVEVANVGTAPLTNVQYLDTIIYDANLIIGTITVNPETLLVDRSAPGKIIISGNLSTIEPTEFIPISYTIKIDAIANPGIFNIQNTAMVTSGEKEAVAACSQTIEAVRFRGNKCCTIVDGNKGIFTISISNIGNSPATTVSAIDQIMIPNGAVVQFNDFGGCTAVFANTGLSVPTNTSIKGPELINITCSGINISQNGSVQKNIALTVISTDVIGGTAIIDNILVSVELFQRPDQILIGVENIPSSAKIGIVSSLQCQDPCI